MRRNFGRGVALCWTLLAAIIAMTLPGSAQQLEKKKVIIAVGGVTGQVDKLAYAVALHKGFFKDEGLEVESVDFGSGAKALQAMIGGSADVTQGSFEHTVRMQPKGVELVAFSIFARYGGNVLVIPKAKAREIKTVADLKGKTIGISSPGSATHIFIARLLEKAGMKIEDAKYIAVGNGPSAVAAIRKGGELDALVNLDPNISELEAGGDVVVLVDGRSPEGMKQVYGGDYIVNSLYAKSSWVKENPNSAQAMTNAIVHAMKWLEKATPDEVTAAMPEDYSKANPAVYKAALAKNMSSFLWDGIGKVENAQRVLETIAIFEPELKTAKIDLAKTFDNQFTQRAHKKYP
jgi:NitT/TauT family transport system substrate-binding protein